MRDNGYEFLIIYIKKLNAFYYTINSLCERDVIIYQL